MARESNWRGDIASINYIETSTWTRQEHNGFSHQNPSFIGAVLNLKPTAARVYLPPDANTFLSTLDRCMKSKNYVNLMVGSKQPSAVLLSADEAENHCRAGASVWRFASTDEGLNPDVVGTELTFEVIAAAMLLKVKAPGIRIRVVNVTDLMIPGAESSHPHSLTEDDFDSLFTADVPIHFNYHGYGYELKGLLFGRPNLGRVSIASYIEEGSTTTPFNMMLLNETSRFHVAKAAVKGAAKRNEKVRLRQHELLSELDHEIRSMRKTIIETKTGRSFQQRMMFLCSLIPRTVRSRVLKRHWRIEGVTRPHFRRAEKSTCIPEHGHASSGECNIKRLKSMMNLRQWTK